MSRPYRSYHFPITGLSGAVDETLVIKTAENQGLEIADVRCVVVGTPGANDSLNMEVGAGSDEPVAPDTTPSSGIYELSLAEPFCSPRGDDITIRFVVDTGVTALDIYVTGRLYP